MVIGGQQAAPRSPFSQEARGQSLAAQAGFRAPTLAGPRPPAAPRSFYPGGAPTATGGGIASVAAKPAGFDFQSALTNDPLLRLALSGISGQGTAAQGALDAQRSALLAQYGQIPGNVGFDPSQEARDLAGEATRGGVSTTAQLARAYQQQQAGDAARAAARGLGRSGLVGQFTNENLQGYQTQQYNALNALLSQLGQARSTYEQQQQALRQQAASETGNALQRLIAQINAGQVA